MSDRVVFDAHEVKVLDADLLRAVTAAPKQTRSIVQKGSLNIKTDARRRISGLKHAPSYPGAITYDSHETATAIWSEIGPDKTRRQGALGNLLEYGSVKNAPKPHMGPAAQAELPRFEKAMTDLAEKLLGGAT